MKRLAVIFLTVIITLLPACESAEVRDYYQIKIYSLDNEVQESRMDHYLENAFLPALHRAGMENIGVFKPMEGEKFIMVFIPYESLQEFDELAEILAADEAFQHEGRDYIQATHDDPPYARIESILLKAFKAMPKFSVPELSAENHQRVYELRSYEGATEKIYERKVEMFNEAGEVVLFKKLDFNPVFFGEVISGAHMPNLMYMTTFSDEKSQEERWDAFQNHPEWLEMKDMEKYKNTVSNITRYLMYPTAYSGI